MGAGTRRQVKTMRAAQFIIHDKRYALQSLVISIGQIRNRFETDQLIPGTRSGNMKSNVFQLIGRCAQMRSIDSDETADHLGRNPVDIDFELQLQLFGPRRLRTRNKSSKTRHSNGEDNGPSQAKQRRIIWRSH